MRVKKGKVETKKANEKDTSRPAETVLQDTSNTAEVAEETVIRLCGCRHGDLSEVKCFAKRQWQRITALQTSSWRAGVA
jgi:hypothetical protein